MKTVCLQYPSGSAKQLKQMKKFKVAASTKGSSFRGFISRELPQFYNLDYFLILEKNGSLTKLDETKTFAQLEEGKKITLQLVFTKIDVSVNLCGKQTKKITLDSRETVGENIKKHFTQEEAKYYVFAFTPIDDSFTRITCQDMSLVTQGWFGEQLHIVRRVLPTEYQNLHKLFEECCFSADLGLTFMEPQDWVETCILKLKAEKKLDIPIQAQKKIIMHTLPPNIRIDDELISYTQKMQKQNSKTKMSSDEAMEKYINISTTNGGQCCFIDKVQFLIIDSKWRMTSQRFLYVSATAIFVTKDLGTSMVAKVFLNEISDFSFENGFLTISFVNKKEKWKIKSMKNKDVLFKVFKDVLSFVTKPIETDKLFNPQLSPKSSTANLPHISAQSSLTGSALQHSPDPSDPTDFVERSRDELLDMSRMQNQEIEQSILFSSNSDEMFYEKRPGLSELIVPTPDQKDEPFNVSSHVCRNLQCDQRVYIPEKVAKSDSSEEEDESDNSFNPLGNGAKKNDTFSFLYENSLFKKIEGSKTTKNALLITIILFFLLILKVIF